MGSACLSACQRLLSIVFGVTALSHGVAMAGGEVTFAFFSREWPPFEIVVDGKPGGAAVDLFRELMPRDVTGHVDLFTTPRSNRANQEGPVYARLECRDWIDDSELRLWSLPILCVKTVMYSSSLTPREYEGEASLHGLIVGCIKRFAYPAVQDLFASGKATRYDVNNELVLLRMLKAGRVDVALFDAITVAWLLRTSGEMDAEDFHIAEKALSCDELCFVFNHNKRWSSRLPEINRLILENRANGRIDSILARYR